MKKVLQLTIIFFLFLTPVLHAQKENNVWMFPPYYGLDFNGPAPTAITSKVPWVAINAVASVCDVNGQLLFYTNTDTIWDRKGNPMPTCTTSAWRKGYPAADDTTVLSYNAPQGVIILPVLNNPQQYYVFVMSGSSAFISGSGGWDFRLNYSIVDMSLNGGLGDVVSGKAHVHLDSALDCAMAAVPGDNCNIWLLVHSRTSTTFKAYDITASGVNTTPVLSNAGTFTSLGSYSNGEMAVSPNRKKIALTDQNILFNPPLGAEMCDFDPATGKASNAIMLDTLGLDQSVCFSPDNTKLYVSQYGPTYPNSALVQYDITLSTPAAIVASQVPIIDSFDLCAPACGAAGEIRAGPDGKIYCTANADSTGMSQYIGCINSPNLRGTACNYVNNAIYFPAVSYMGLAQSLGTNFVKPLPPDTLYKLTDTSMCIPGAGQITLHAPAGYNWLWNTGSIDSVITVRNGGKYFVRSVSYCTVTVDTFVVKYNDVSFDLGNDTTFCMPPFPYVLRVSVPGVDYRWQSGSRDSFYTVTKTGHYSVTVSRDGCEDSAAVNIAYIDAKQDLGTDTIICADQPIQLSLQANVPDGATAIWSNGSYNTSLMVEDTGRYWVMVTDGPCLFSDSISVSKQLCECAFNMPSVFSPNGDGKNDLFRPIIQPGCNVSRFMLKIYNRWGQMVWMSYSPSEGWDGTFQGVPQEIGDYMYLVELTAGTKDKQIFRKGDVTLVR
ncbi:MAG: gliding motility-associated C-terminal domain-containing protein [Bacteroidetes bacterium]|nr:gliding motility-associated C-terminal domain-containing protein [Bacteroidota bacterium]